MDEDKRKQVCSLTRVAIVAPVWLQHALVVFLHSVPELKLVACTASVQVLLALDLPQTPELIIIETDKKYENAQKQIRRCKAAWPDTRIIALIPHEALRRLAQAAGADEVLVSGIAPEQLRLAISRLCSDKDVPIGPVEGNQN